MYLKICGIGLLLSSGYLSAVYVLLPEKRCLMLLEEGLYLFSKMESCIRNEKTVLPLLFRDLSQETQTLWSDFFSFLSSEMENGGDLLFSESFVKKLHKQFGDIFSTSVLMTFSNIGRNLLSDDEVDRRRKTENMTRRLEAEIGLKRQEYVVKRKISIMLGMSITGLISIMLL